MGPGKLSLDAARGKEKSGTKAALTALVLGVAGAAGAHLAAEAMAPPPAPAPVEPLVPEPAVEAPTEPLAD